ncbi:MAG: Ig-like domain-containing protein [Armatimonadota bacterium]
MAAILLSICSICLAAPVSLEIRPEPPRMVADGKSVGIININARDASGRPVSDGTTVQLTATLGQLRDNSVSTTNGMATVEIVSAAVKGKGTITASIPGQAIASVQIAFVDEADASVDIPEYFSLDGGGYLAYSSDYKIIEAFSENEAVFSGGQVSVRSLSWQYDTRSNGLVAHQAVLTRRGKSQNYYRLLYYPMSDSGIGLIEKDDGSIETVMLEQGEFKKPDTSISEHLFDLKDMSDSQVLFIMKRGVLVPNQRVQMFKVRMYVSGMKAVSIPLYDMSLQSQEPLGQSFLGASSNGLTVDLPIYYSMRPGSVGALHIRRGQIYSSSADGGEKVWSIDLVQNYSRSGKSQGEIGVYRANRDDWSVRWNHNITFNKKSSGYLYLDTPSNSAVFGNTGYSLRTNSGRLGLSLSGNSEFSGDEARSARGQAFWETKPINLTPRLRMTVSPSVSYEWLQALSTIRQQTIYGTTARFYTNPYRALGFSFIPTGSIGYRDGNENYRGVTKDATVMAIRDLGNVGALSLVYNYHDSPQATYTSKQMLSAQLSMMPVKWMNLSVGGSKALDIENDSLVGSLAFKLGDALLLGADYSGSRYIDDQYDELVMWLGYRLGVRQMNFSWSNKTHTWRFDILNASW